MTAPTEAPANPVRTCVACGKRDDHPKHQIDLGGGQSTYHHHDCGAAMDPDCKVCSHLLETHDGGTGEAMREHLASQSPKMFEHAGPSVFDPLVQVTDLSHPAAAHTFGADESGAPTTAAGGA